MARHPDRAVIGRMDITTTHPEVRYAVPAPESRTPYPIARCHRHRRRGFHDRYGRGDADDNLGRTRYRTGCQEQRHHQNAAEEPEIEHAWSPGRLFLSL